MKSYDTQHNPEVWAVGSKYGPLQCSGLDYLCPDCGGYGYLLDKDKTCEFCNGDGFIALDDSRITTDEQINMDVNNGKATAKINRNGWLAKVFS